MKFTIAAGALALASAVSAWTPYPCTLTQEQADDIVGGFRSILQNQTWNGKPPVELYKEYLSPEYKEYSDSILSLVSKNNTLGIGTPAAVDREVWYQGVVLHPIPKINTHDILVAGDSNILWHWTFDGIGIARYPSKGFNLFRIDENLQIAAVDIEFNNIAWGVDIFEIQQYCKP